MQPDHPHRLRASDLNINAHEEQSEVVRNTVEKAGLRVIPEALENIPKHSL